MSTEQNEVTRAEFARLNGWARSYVTKLDGQGRLVLTEDGRRVKVAESLALIAQTEGRRQDVKARHQEARRDDGEEGQGSDVPAQAASGEELVAELLRALTSPRIEDALAKIPTAANLVKNISEARRVKAIADQEEMNRDQQAGALIAREDVDFVLNDFGATLRGLLENLPDKLAPVVYPLTTLEETHVALEEACEAVLLEMSETMKRRTKEMGA